MGYLAKHIKVRRFKRTMRIIAMAALAGCVFELRLYPGPRTSDEPYPNQVKLWGIIWSDGLTSQNHATKRQAALRYLKWFLGRHDALAELERRANG